MPIRDNYPLPFLPVGLSDGVDQTGTFLGACQNLSNFVFDRTNRGAVVPRPGVPQQTNFAAFLSAAVLSVGAISVQMQLGTKIYGMIAALSGTLAGFDAPFVYDTANNTFTAVTGATTGNTPQTQALVGPWTPPTMAQCGNKVVVTHPGFTGGNFIGWFDITTPSAPTWTAGNTTTNLLPSKPIWVATFTNRFYFGCTNSAVFSDAPAAWGVGTITISNTNFAAALTIGDAANTTAAYFNPIKITSGGTLQGLLIWKPTAIWQVTGDIGTSNLALNQISSTEGCAAPRSIQAMPQGIAFMGTNGIRLVDTSNNLAPLNLDVVAPFTNCVTPSRACAGYNNGVYRICVDTVFKGQTFTADYWFDVQYNRWNGPHSFAYSVVIGLGNEFYLGSNTTPGILFRSDPTPYSSSIYTDNSVNYTCMIQSAAMADSHPMHQKQIVESTIELSGITTSGAYFIQALNDQNTLLSSATISISSVVPLWGAVFWGAFNWAFSILGSHVYNIPWPNPIVFQKLIFSLSIQAGSNVSVKNLWMRYQDAGYTNAQ